MLMELSQIVTNLEGCGMRRWQNIWSCSSLLQNGIKL